MAGVSPSAELLQLDKEGSDGSARHTRSGLAHVNLTFQVSHDPSPASLADILLYYTVSGSYVRKDIQLLQDSFIRRRLGKPAAAVRSYVPTFPRAQ
jgi:hypothetical protein